MVKSAVILAGGKGTRLGAMTQNTPKPLVLVNEQPFLYWQLRHLQSQGVEDVLLLVSYLAEQIQTYFEQHPIAGLRIRYSLEPEPLGTGGALRLALPMLPEQFWLLNGDSFLPLEFAEMERSLQLKNWSACMALAPAGLVADAVANVNCEGSLVSEYSKSGSGRFSYVDAGVYWMERTVVSDGSADGTFDLGVVWPQLIARQCLGAFKISERFYDIGTPERLKVFEEFLAAGV